MERKELVAAAVAAGITKAHSMKSVVLEEMLSSIGSVKVKGRPVDPNSVRQIRLAELEAKRANGELRLGRPVDTSSERQARLAKQAENKALGIGQGRPVNPNSVRQIRLAELEAKRANGELRRGRPKAIKVEE